MRTIFDVLASICSERKAKLIDWNLNGTYVCLERGQNLRPSYSMVPRRIIPKITPKMRKSHTQLVTLFATVTIKFSKKMSPPHKVELLRL